MNLEALKRAYDAAVEELHKLRTALDEAHKRVMEAPEDATSEELATRNQSFDEAATAFDEASAEVERTKRNLADAERREKILADNPVAARGTEPAIRVGNEPPVYGPESGEDHSFFSDAYRYKENADPVARERLERHGRQNVDAINRSAERETQRRREIAQRAGIESPIEPYQFRDVGTGAFAGLTIPQYLVDLFAPYARAGAPTLNLIARKLPLPPKGMTLNISRATTGSAAAAQASENTGVQETDFDDTLLTINVRTYAGQQDVSRQALERSEMVDAVIYQDLTSSYFTVLDAAILNADGTSGTHLGIKSTSGIVAVTYTDASPTLAELYPKGSDAVQQINAGVFAPATAWVMHPRRWGWMEASLDSSNRPLVVPDANVAYNPIAVGDAAAYGQVVGKWHGLPVVTDGNVLTNQGGGTEDNIFGVSGYNLLFWQEGDGMPRQLKFEQSNAPQSVRLAVWGYSAFSAGRYPLADASISGTGLAAPTF
jgi:HK97 family phage major capsid protein